MIGADGPDLLPWENAESSSHDAQRSWTPTSQNDVYQRVHFYKQVIRHFL
jgi:hypothetical protein